MSWGKEDTRIRARPTSSARPHDASGVVQCGAGFGDPWCAYEDMEAAAPNHQLALSACLMYPLMQKTDIAKEEVVISDERVKATNAIASLLAVGGCGMQCCGDCSGEFGVDAVECPVVVLGFGEQ